MARSITDIVSDILGVADAGGWLRSLGHIRYPTSTAGVTEQFTSVSTSNLLNFMANSVSDKQPSFPLRMFENLKVLQTGYEDGTERVTQGVCYHAREWDVSFNVVNRDDTESFRRFFDSLKGSDKSFFWMEPYLTTRQDVKVGHGNGRQNSWVIPIIGCSSITIMDSNSATAIGYTIYSGPPFSGQHNLPVVLFDTAPQPNQTVTMSYVDGYYVPIVRVKEVFSPELRVPDYSWFQITLKETKEDYPNA